MNTDELITQFQYDPKAVPSRWPHLKEEMGYLSAHLSTRDLTVRVKDPAEAAYPDDRTFPQVELGITAFNGSFHINQFDRMNKEDLRCLAALLLQVADRMP